MESDLRPFPMVYEVYLRHLGRWNRGAIVIAKCVGKDLPWPECILMGWEAGVGLVATYWELRTVHPCSRCIILVLFGGFDMGCGSPQDQRRNTRDVQETKEQLQTSQP